MQCSVGNGLDRSGTLSYMAQRDLWQSLSGGQRALRPQARFGGQPPQAALGPEKAALPRNYQQMRNIFLRPSGLDRERRLPYKWGSVYHECYMCNRVRLSAGSGNPALPRF